MKKTFLLTICLLLSFTVFAQNNMDRAYDHVHWAMILKKQNRYSESLKYFDKAFNLGFIEDPHYKIEAAYSALKIGDEKRAQGYLSDAVSKYRVPKSFVTENSSLKEFENSKVIKNISENYNRLLGQFYANQPNVEDYIDILNMRETDQFARNLPSPTESTPDVKKFLDGYKNYVMNHTDSTNIERFAEITKKNGYMDSGYLLLWHQRLEYPNSKEWQYFKPVIEKEIEKGKIRRWFFTNFEDQASLLHHRNQIYGTFFDYRISPLKNVKTVDQERLKVGLPPLIYMNYIYGQPLPAGYEKSVDEMLAEMEKRVQ